MLQAYTVVTEITPESIYLFIISLTKGRVEHGDLAYPECSAQLLWEKSPKVCETKGRENVHACIHTSGGLWAVSHVLQQGKELSKAPSRVLVLLLSLSKGWRQFQLLLGSAWMPAPPKSHRRSWRSGTGVLFVILCDFTVTEETSLFRADEFL